jgi:hypothetical protein
VRKLIRGNDTQFADFPAIFIRENISVYGMLFCRFFSNHTNDDITVSYSNLWGGGRAAFKGKKRLRYPSDFPPPCHATVERFRYVVSGIEIGMSGKENLTSNLCHCTHPTAYLGVWHRVKAKKSTNVTLFANIFLWHGSSQSQARSRK